MTVAVPPVATSPEGSTLGGARPFLQTRALGKRFGAVVALDDVDFTANLGEVTALVGDNGAGKSTLIKVLAGAHPATTGDVWVEGEKVKFASPIDAGNHGIATIYQELALADNLSVYENVFLGRELTRRVAGIPFLDRRAMRDRVEQILTDLDAHLPSITTQVANLSGGQRQAVAISRALNLDAKLFIMDEPTAALAVAETRKVLDLILQLRDAGRAVILISHNIGDVFEVADRIVILRRGRKVAERAKADTDPTEIVGLITGAISDA